MDNKDYPKTELIEKADVTELFDSSDIENNKFLALLSYVSFLVLIPVLDKKGSRFARFHANQGLTLFLLSVIINAVAKFMGKIPLIGWLFGLLAGAAALGVLGLSILGILNVVNGRARRLPFVGHIKLLK